MIERGFANRKDMCKHIQKLWKCSGTNNVTVDLQPNKIVGSLEEMALGRPRC